LPVESSLYLFLEPTLWRLGSNENRTTSGLTQTSCHMLLPMFARNQHPSVEPDVQLCLICKSNADLFHERTIDMRVAEKYIISIFGTHSPLPATSSSYQVALLLEHPIIVPHPGMATNMLERDTATTLHGKPSRYSQPERNSFSAQVEATKSLKRVRLGSVGVLGSSLLCPDERTSSARPLTSEKCQ